MTAKEKAAELYPYTSTGTMRWAQQVLKQEGFLSGANWQASQHEWVSMKTALGELIEDFESRSKFSSDLILSSVWERAVELLKEKLPKERQQIEDALLYGHAEATDTSPVIDLSFTERYFTKKFEQ